jgi:hypothetical protein
LASSLSTFSPSSSILPITILACSVLSLPKRGESPLRLHKAHVEGKQVEAAQDLETRVPH